ncbi:MAG: dephospho-CoA kinase [Alphaproteobacteria bacterium]|nr:dephospho-CoA kinase [Alphaproteobacteria bacterium]
MTRRGPLLIGLTGSIGMGKSETARMFRKLGVPVYDSDAAVHRLYDRGGAAVDAIAREFPGTVADGAVDRAALSKAVAARPDGFAVLERIVHPLVAADEQRFLAHNHDAPIVVLDVPLLFEAGGYGRMDVIVVVSAPSEIQRARVLARPGMSAEKLDLILSRQLADAEKRKRADFVVDTSKGLDDAFAQVRTILEDVRRRL